MAGGFEKDRRKKVLINREIQLGIAARFVIIFLLFLFLSTAVVFLPSAWKLLTGASLEELEKPATEFLVLHKRIWPMVLLVAIGVVFYTVSFTHRIVGPVFRLNREMENMISGKFPERIILRQKDYFKDTAALLEEISRKMRECEKKKEEAETILSELLRESPGDERIARLHTILTEKQSGEDETP